jgi:hypothetical protein
MGTRCFPTHPVRMVRIWYASLAHLVRIWYAWYAFGTPPVRPRYAFGTPSVRIGTPPVRIWYASGTHPVRGMRTVYASCVPYTHHAYRIHIMRTVWPCLDLNQVPWAAVSRQVLAAESFKLRRLSAFVCCSLFQLQGHAQRSLADEHCSPTRPDALNAAVLQNIKLQAWQAK